MFLDTEKAPQQVRTGRSNNGARVYIGWVILIRAEESVKYTFVELKIIARAHSTIAPVPHRRAIFRHKQHQPMQARA
jgi:hypothetical protein